MNRDNIESLEIVFSCDLVCGTLEKCTECIENITNLTNEQKEPETQK